MVLVTLGAIQQRPFREHGLKAKEIVYNSFRTDKKNTAHVSVLAMETMRRGWNITTLTKIPGERARKHRVRVWLPKDYEGRFTRSPEVYLDCDCMRHLFVWNWALLQKGVALKDHTNGQPPDITNPGYVPGCCKHALVSLRALMVVDPRWPDALIGNRAHPRQGKPVTLTTLKQADMAIRKGKTVGGAIKTITNPNQ